MLVRVPAEESVRTQGTWATTTPCEEHLTRGASASSSTWTVPRSNVRHRRRPSPWSYQGARLWHPSRGPVRYVSFTVTPEHPR
jgi:phage-related protein